MPTNGRRPSAPAASETRRKSEIDIIFDQNSDFLPCYATHDQIRGHVELKFDKDTAVTDLMIALEGQSITYIEQKDSTAPSAARTTSKHVFLRLFQPISANSLPEEGTAEAGISYTIPFTFVIPGRLLPYSCDHQVRSDEVKQRHMELPPSLGDQSCLYEGHPFMDDGAPDMAKITYSICAKVSRSTLPNHPSSWIEKREVIRIVPTRDEEPPMNVIPGSVDYTLRRETTVRKGLLKFGKLGKLTAETSQPRSLHLPHPRSASHEPVTTMITISLRFDPVNIDDQPPQLGSVVSKLKIYTFFSNAAYVRICEPHQCDEWSAKHGMYLESLELSSPVLSSVSWMQQDLFYEANVLLPISLPTMTKSGCRKVFPPTFHSCIISRIYAVELNMSYHTPGSNVGTSHIILQLPIQISAEGGTPPVPEIGSQEAIVTEGERQFRSGQIPWDELELEAPVYEELPTLQARRASLGRGAPPVYRPQSGGLITSGLGSESVSISA